MLLTKHEGKTFFRTKPCTSAARRLSAASSSHARSCSARRFTTSKGAISSALQLARGLGAHVGQPRVLREIKALVNLMEQAQLQQLPQATAAAPGSPGFADQA